MSSSPARLDDLQQKFTEQPRRYFAPLANALRQAGDVDAAVELCRGYLAELPDHLSGHVVLALALRDRGDLDGSRAEFERALALDAENVLALRALGELACRRGDERDAAHWYERLVSVDPHDPDAVSRLAALRADVAPAEHGHDDHRAVAWAPPPAEPPAAPPSAHEEPPAFAPADHAAEVAPVEEGVFTAGIFATVLDEPVEPAAPATDGAAASEALPPAEPLEASAQAEQPAAAPDAAAPAEPAEPPAEAPPRVSQSVFVGAADMGELDVDRDLAALLPSQDEALRSDDIDRLFAELPPLGAALELPPGDGFGAESPLGGGSALASDNPLDEIVPPSDEIVAAAEIVPPSDEMVAAEEIAPPSRAGVPGEGVSSGDELEIQAAAIEELVIQEPAVEEPVAQAPLLEAPVAEEPPVEPPIAAAEEPVSPPGAEPRVAFVTETMAELYLRQGFHAEARHVYEQLLAQHPDDAALRARVEELTSAATATSVDHGSEGAPAGAAPAEEVPMDWDEAVRGLASIELAPEPPAPPAPDAEPSGAADRDASARTVGDWLRGLTRATPEPTAVVAEAAAEPEASDLPDARMEQEAPDATAVREQSAESEVTPEAEAPSVVLEQYEEPVVVAAETPMESMILVREFEESGPMPAADVAATPDDLEMDTEPATEPEPAAEPEAAAEPEPTVEREAVAEAEPLLEAEPIAEPEPVVEPEAVAEAAEAAGPATLGPQPTAEEDPFGWGEVASSEPVPGPMTTFEAGTLEVVGADDRSGMEPVEQPEAGTAATAPSLDELFARPVAPAAEAAAGTLVAATLSLQDDRDIDAQLSQAASDDPASLEHVLRETAPAVPGRPTPTFSFEQFFTPALGTAPAPEQPTAQAPAETEAAGDDDLDEFHAWLAGLSDS